MLLRHQAARTTHRKHTACHDAHASRRHEGILCDRAGGFPGVGERLLAIPWGALTLDTTHKYFLLDVPAEIVHEASGLQF